MSRKFSDQRIDMQVMPADNHPLPPLRPSLVRMPQIPPVVPISLLTDMSNSSRIPADCNRGFPLQLMERSKKDSFRITLLRSTQLWQIPQKPHLCLRHLLLLLAVFTSHLYDWSTRMLRQEERASVTHSHDHTRRQPYPRPPTGHTALQVDPFQALPLTVQSPVHYISQAILIRPAITRNRHRLSPCRHTRQALYLSTRYPPRHHPTKFTTQPSISPIPVSPHPCPIKEENRFRLACLPEGRQTLQSCKLYILTMDTDHLFLHHLLRWAVE